MSVQQAFSVDPQNVELCREIVLLHQEPFFERNHLKYPCYHTIPTRDFYTYPNQQEQEKGQEKDRKN